MSACVVVCLHALCDNLRDLAPVHVLNAGRCTCMRRSSVKKPKVRQAVVEVIKEAGAGPETPKPVGALLYAAATKVHHAVAVTQEHCRQNGTAQSQCTA